MILVGDHQPPAAVTGEDASWDVPMHVIASRRELLDRLLRHGFRKGLTPTTQPLMKINAMLPVLLDGFGDAGHLEGRNTLHMNSEAEPR
jgi:hypothetical protein